MPWPTSRPNRGGILSGITRRAFLASTTALAAAFAIPREALGAVLAEPLKPADVPTTLQQTIRHSSQSYKKYRTLVAAPGEPYVARLDVLKRNANPARTGRRRSLLYLGHLTDLHMIDAQSPARLEPMAGMSQSLWAGVVRPQDTMQTHTLTAMTNAMNAAKYSPVTGAPMTAAVNTGDSADELSNLELRWYIDLLDGATLTPNSGKQGVYEGVQVWKDTPYAWHPEDPSKDDFGAYGFPTLPGMLEAAVSKSVSSPGLAAPWFAVFGNHDTLLNGVIPVDSGLRKLATGDRKAAQWGTLTDTYLRGMATDSSSFTRLTNQIWTQLGMTKGMETVSPDGQRKLLDGLEFMAAHLQSTPAPGPVGHGFTQDNMTSGKTYWTSDLNENFRLFGLDTCNQTAGPDGAVPQDQFDWLKDQLEQAQAQKKMAIILSHHNSSTLENGAEPVIGGQPLIHADEFISMLQQYPCMVAWLNGHTHINTITAHPKSGGGGFWEITSASCVDYPQQQQLVEFVDNQDGTMSIFTTALDHMSPAVWSKGDYSQTGLASLSRQLSANDWIANPPMRVGSPLDRNTELLLDAPFPLSAITDGQLAKERAVAQARLVAHEGKQPR